MLYELFYTVHPGTGPGTYNVHTKSNNIFENPLRKEGLLPNKKDYVPISMCMLLWCEAHQVISIATL